MLDSNIQSSESSNVFKSRILKFIWPKVNSFLNYLYPKRVKLITGLQLGLSNLQNVKFKHSFQELSQPYYAVVVLKSKQLRIICFTVSTTYMKEKSFWIKTVLSNIFEQSDSFINSFLLFGDISADDSSNAIILNTTMKYMTSTRRSSIFTVLYLRFQRNNKYFIEINLKSIFKTNFLYFLVHYFKLAF